MENELKIAMDDYLPLRDVVFKTLRGAILRGDLKPGQRLMEIQLANQLGVSRTPVREAIRMLELEGLVIMVPRRGAQVAQITEKSMSGIADKKYTFKVAKDANKIEIAEAVAELFKVEVAKVNTINVRGKQKRMGRYSGYTASWKKAIVTLTEDSKTIEFFDGMF